MSPSRLRGWGPSVVARVLWIEVMPHGRGCCRKGLEVWGFGVGGGGGGGRIGHFHGDLRLELGVQPIAFTVPSPRSVFDCPTQLAECRQLNSPYCFSPTHWHQGSFWVPS